MAKKLLLLGLIVILIFQTVQAAPAQNEIAIGSNTEMERVFYRFIACMNRKDMDVYNCIDTSNEELQSNIQSYVFSESSSGLYSEEFYVPSFHIKTDVKKITEENGVYNIKTRIRAEGKGLGGSWSVNGFTANFQVSQIDGEYKVIDTDLFDIIGPKNVGIFLLKVFAIIGGVFLLTILIIVFSALRSTKKRKQENTMQSPIK